MLNLKKTFSKTHRKRPNVTQGKLNFRQLKFKMPPVQLIEFNLVCPMHAYCPFKLPHSSWPIMVCNNCRFPYVQSHLNIDYRCLA